MSRLMAAFFAGLLMCSMVGANEAKPRSGEEIYQAFCKTCHATGVAGAPIAGDKASWQKHLEEDGGLEHLVEEAITGEGAMPPRGLCNDCTDEEIRIAVEYMIAM